MTVLTIAALLFVVGVVINAISVNAPQVTWGNRIAWILWAVAAILWYVTLIAK